MSKRKSFVMHQSWATLIRELPNEQAGDLIKAICRYQDDPEAMPEDPIMAAVFGMIREKLDEDADAYEETCRRRSEAAAARWADAKASNSMQKDANAYNSMQKDGDTESDTESDSESSYEDEDARARAREAAASFELADGSSWSPEADRVREYEKGFPELDVRNELLRCAIKHNAMDARRRKNVTNVEQYIVNWLITAQSDQKKTARSGTSFADIPQREPVATSQLMKELAAKAGNLI